MSSLGVAKRDTFPFKILDTYGVLYAKAWGETVMVETGYGTERAVDDRETGAADVGL